MSHVNIGRYQILYWPRRVLAFYRGNYPDLTPLKPGIPSADGIYSWIVYLWPIEVRRFVKKPSTQEDRP